MIIISKLPKHQKQLLFATIVAALISLEPTIAYADDLAPITSALQYVTNFLRGTFARVMAILSVAICGFMCIFGVMRWSIFGMIVLGIALIFGAPTIVDTLSGAVGSP